MCSIQRPLDDRTQLRIQIEAEAVLRILAACESGSATLVVSDALAYEAGRNPYPVRKDYAVRVMEQAQRHVQLSSAVEDRARALNQDGLKPLDALHLACAAEVSCNYLCTCDDRFLRRARAIQMSLPQVVNPLELATEMER